jgi:hypothetical protein
MAPAPMGETGSLSLAHKVIISSKGSGLVCRAPAEQGLFHVRNGLCNRVEGRKAALETDCFSKRKGAERKHNKANNLQRNESFPAKYKRQHP